ncbi:thiol peroxidase [Alkaliphilus peptidifermentans]|uniref:Thiol peroxidase n=1 Tax=Alkaliphilus peptidifermentans DSM 18978 TaxID=1120976 RepID=A0A1G5FK72_9FIRM|nr:thiol peroxidase [Alkaliphilus peptidifermentans]SCY39656.1 thiol peroxidase (atypical 2-Cys peroxiredoxin) [Alkaliphilus peptidifermentans DSM 18978]
MDKRKSVVTMKGNPVTLLGKEMMVGDIAPNFTAVTKDLKEFTLKDMEGKIKLISVVPSIDTGVCDLQTMTFNEEAEKLNNTVVVTISMDLPFALNRYCAAKGLENAITLSDHREASFGLAYGFLIEELRLLARGVIVLDQNNKVIYVEYVNEISQQPNYDKALETVKQL